MINTRLCLLAPLTCWFLLSCNHDSLTTHYSNRLLDSALIIGVNGHSDQAVRMVNEHFASFASISVLDRYRFYRFGFDLHDAYYSKSYDPARALAYADSMVWLLEQHGLTFRLPREYADARSLQGQIYIEQKRYSEAFRVYGLCRLAAEKIGDSCLVAEYNSTMGTVRFRQAEYRKAIDLYLAALSMHGTCKPNSTTYHDVQGLLANIAFAFTKAGDNDSALVYYRRAEQYIREKKDMYTTDTVFPSIALAVVNGNEALAEQAKGDYAGAETLLKQAIAINELPGRDNATAVIEKLHLAGLYLLQHKNNDAFRLLKETANPSPADVGTLKLWLSTMCQYQEQIGNPEQAFKYLKQSLALSDSIATQERKSFAGTENNTYRLLEAQYNLELLRKDNTIQQMSLLIGALILIALCYIVIMSRKNLRRHKQLLTELDQRNKEKDRILQVVAHDLRSPIGGIKMMTQLLAQKGESKDKKMLSMMQESAAQCLVLVNDLLSGGIIGEKPALERSAFDLRELVDENVRLMQFNALEKNQKIEMTLPLNPQPVFADAEKIARVLNNIISNSIKFSPKGSTIRVGLQASATNYCIAIRDEGMGIPGTQWGTMFELSALTRRPGTQGEKSFGLGLSISRQIVEAHDGKLWVQSEEGKGTEFVIELPSSGNPGNSRDLR